MSGLPKSLEILLGSLLDSFDLQSWSIFSEKNGGCCLKIKWKPSSNTSDTPQGDTIKPPVQKFRKKSPSIIKRDQQRSSEYHSSIVTRSRAKVLQSEGTVEQPRCDHQVSNEHIYLSPEPVESPTSEVLMDSPTDPIKLKFTRV